MIFDLDYQNNILFARFSGNLCKKYIKKIDYYLLSIIKKYNVKYLVCNLRNLHEIDTSGMDALATLKKTIKNNKGKMYLCFVNETFKHYLNVLRIQNIDNELVAKELINNGGGKIRSKKIC